MKLKKIIFGVMGVAMLMLSQGSAFGQSSSLNTYSPYTFYGIGDIHEEGIAVTRAMGGASIGFRNPFYVNVTNPASYSSVRSNSFLSNFDMEGQNFYARTSDAKTSFNTFNIRDIAMSFPLIKNMGVGFSVTPYSSVGYRVQYYDTNPVVQAGIGQMLYAYSGSGDVTQFKLGLGYEVVKNLSLGAEVIYYHGLIERTYNAIPTVITGEGSYQPISGLKSESVNSFYGKFGVQWTPLARRNTVLTVGATYQMGGKMGNEVEDRLAQNSTLAPDVYAVNEVYTSDFSMPNVYAVGFYLHKDKYSIGADYQFADWGERNKQDITATRSFRNTNTVRLGGQYTPNPGDVRHALKRWTYRAGVRWSQYYIVLNDQPFDDVALTFGVGVPLRMTGLSNVNLGLELGQRGTIKAGLSRENYLKFTIGFSLFGEDYWFVKMKYD
ncbi:MAG: hypothetical protein IJF01_00330 [Tidjanibacter sp.]|nr:hypothetical protein [Tidjanibacter sp.]